MIKTHKKIENHKKSDFYTLIPRRAQTNLQDGFLNISQDYKDCKCNGPRIIYRVSIEDVRSD